MTTPLRYLGPDSVNGKAIARGKDTLNVLGSGSGMVKCLRPPRAVGIDTAHSSAPSIYYSKTYNKLFMLYRQGTDHFVSRDGIFKLTSSSDLGKTWSAAVTVQDLTPTWDSQGQGISESNDGTKLWMSYFKASAANGAAGVFFKTSTDGGTSWSAETRIDTSLPYAATTDVIRQLANGDMVMAYYGRSGAETFDSIWIAKSTNGGTSWTSTRLANGQTASLHFDEPVIAINGTTAVITGRYGGIQSIGTTVSTNSTSSWGTFTERFPGTGKPHLFWLNSTTLVCIYRELSTGHAKMRSSVNNGAAWSPPRLVDPTMWPSGWMLYASSTRLAPGLEYVAFAQERGDAGASPGASRLYLSACTEAGGITPLGAIDGEMQGVVDNTVDVVYSTLFEQADGTPPDIWSAVINNSSATSLNVANGELSATAVAAGAAFPIARIYCAGLSDVEIEIDIYNLSSGTGSGSGIMTGMTAAGTFLVFVIENAIARLYQYTTGTATLLASSAAITHQFGRYNKLKLIRRGDSLFGFYNDWPVVNYFGTLTTWNGNYHGIKFNATTSAANHKVRRFSIKGV